MSKSIAAGLVSKTDDQHAELTDRQKDVLRLICDDKPIPDIASQLHISVRTLEWHKQKIYEDTRAHSAAGLVTYAIKHGIIPNPEDFLINALKLHS